MTAGRSATGIPKGPSGYNRNSGPGAANGRNPNSYYNQNKRSSSYVNPKFDNKRPKFNNAPAPKGPKSFPVKQPTKLQKDQIYCLKTTRSSEIYQRTQQVGEGTYGKVYKAKNEITNEFVALKRLRLESEREGFPITAIREIKLLQSFDHKNVVGLLEMMVEQNQIFMVFDYMEHDLTGLLTHPDLQLQESHRKFLFKQLMEGLNYLHHKRIIHRDIKGSNILVDSVGILKIADFGLARPMKILKDGESPDYTNRVITIWYRPPELLLGSTDYGREVDIWGVGCLLIELYTKHAAFRGFDEVGQLYEIFNTMGTPTLKSWKNIQNLPWFEMLKPKINKVSTFKAQYADKMSEQSFDLAEKLLQLNPQDRLTASQALNHAYFTQDPKPEPLYFLKDIKGEWHEFETKKRRRKERKRLQEEKERLKQLNANAVLGPPQEKEGQQDISPSTGPRTIPPSAPHTAPHTGPHTAPQTGPDSVPHDGDKEGDDLA
jgi:CTD kinase subunit alpha